MVAIFLVTGVRKGWFWGSQNGHSLKKPRNDRALELAESWRRMSHNSKIRTYNTDNFHPVYVALPAILERNNGHQQLFRYIRRSRTQWEIISVLTRRGRPKRGTLKAWLCGRWRRFGQARSFGLRKMTWSLLSKTKGRKRKALWWNRAGDLLVNFAL